MTNYRVLLRASKLWTPLMLALAFGLEQVWLGMLLSLGLGLWGWFGDGEPEESQAPDYFLLGAIVLLVLGVFLDLAPFLLVAALLGSLVSWDLSRFQKRVAHAPQSKGILEIEQQHLRLLAAAVLGGAVFDALLLLTSLQIHFGVVLVAAVILVISFSEVIRLLRN